MGNLTAQIFSEFCRVDEGELMLLNRRSRKLVNIYGAIHSRDNVARFYLPKKMSGRGLIVVEDCVIQVEMGLVNFVAENNETLLIATTYGTKSVEESPSEYKERKRKERMQDVHGKNLHGQFIKQTENVASDESWM